MKDFSCHTSSFLYSGFSMLPVMHVHHFFHVFLLTFLHFLSFFSLLSCLFPSAFHFTELTSIFLSRFSSFVTLLPPPSPSSTAMHLFGLNWQLQENESYGAFENGGGGRDTTPNPFMVSTDNGEFPLKLKCYISFHLKAEMCLSQDQAG